MICKEVPGYMTTVKRLAVLSLCVTVSAVAATCRAAELTAIDSLYAVAEQAYTVGDYGAAALHYDEVRARIVDLDGGESAYLQNLGRRAGLLSGLSRERADDWEGALATYAVSMAELPEIWDAVTMRMAHCRSELGEGDAAARLLREVIDAPEPTTLFLDAVEQLADLCRESGDHEGALRWYRLFLDQISDYDGRARAHYKIGLTLADKGDGDAALDSFAVAVNEFPRSRHAYDALSEARRASRAFTDRYHQGLVLYNQLRYREAAEFFVYYLRHDRDGKFRSEASYFLGRSHQRRNNFDGAADKYEDAIESGPDSEYFDLAWLKLAYCRRALGRIEESLATYDEYVALYPGRDGVAEALWEKARLLEEKGRWDEAVLVFREVAERSPGSDRAPDALFRAGLCLFKQRRYEEADAAFADLFVDSAEQQAARALFWAGKSRDALRQRDEARARYVEASEMSRDSFYGRRALDRIAADRGSETGAGSPVAESGGGELAFGADQAFHEFAAWLAEWYPLVYVPGERVALDRLLRSDAAFVRADAFLAIHMTATAAGELYLLEESFGSDPRMLDLLINYFESQGLHRRAIRVAERLLAMSPARSISDAPLYLRRMICPEHFGETVTRVCQEYGIDRNLFYSLMRQESLFESDAVSWVGARGLSQIMPHTGRWIAKQLGERGFRSGDLLDPETNIRFGAYYLSVQLEQNGGDVMRALAAYNGGPENVERWWQYGGADDQDVFIEDIGFSQTDDYVRRVYLYARFYREVYGER